MCSQKGFSLIEVLISLILVTVLGLTLVQQQVQTKQLLTQITLRVKASHFLDHVDESLLVGIDKLPVAPDPYHLKVIENKQDIIIQLTWFKDLGSIIRKYLLFRS